MIDLNYTPESLEQCRMHYVPPNKDFITCKEFGCMDGMNGSCHWCREMLPYQWYMCWDESWIKSLLSPAACIPASTRNEAIEFIESYKQKNYTSQE